MSDFDKLFDSLGRNTVHFLATSAHVEWTAFQDEGKVNEGQQLIIQTTTEMHDDELKSFTQQYREASITVMPLSGERQVDEEGQGIVGALYQNEMTLFIRLLVHPNYLIGLSNLISNAYHFPVRVSVWPFKKLWEWNGEGHLLIRECKIAIGSINLKS